MATEPVMTEWVVEYDRPGMLKRDVIHAAYFNIDPVSGWVEFKDSAHKVVLAIQPGAALSIRRKDAA